MSHTNHVTLFAGVGEESEDAIRQIAVADEIAEDVAVLSPTGERLWGVERSTLSLTHKSRDIQSQAGRQFHLDLSNVDSRYAQIPHVIASGYWPFAASLISWLMFEISAAHRRRSRWASSMISLFGQWK
jgi:hypothetical protein